MILKGSAVLGQTRQSTLSRPPRSGSNAKGIAASAMMAAARKKLRNTVSPAVFRSAEYCSNRAAWASEDLARLEDGKIEAGGEHLEVLDAPGRHGRQAEGHPHHARHGDQRRPCGPVALAHSRQCPVQYGRDDQPEAYASQQQLQRQLRVVHAQLPARAEEQARRHHQQPGHGQRPSAQAGQQPSPGH